MADFGELAKQFNKFREKAVEDEKAGNGDYQWIQYGTRLPDTERGFKRLIPSITDFLTERKKVSPTYALDFMGDGQAMRDLSNTGAINAGLSITLNDFRKPDVKISDSKLGVDVLSGNILDGRKTRELKDWIETKNPKHPYFDLIMSNPGIGFVSFRAGRLAYGLVENIFWQGVNLLNPKGGVMVTYIPDIFRDRKSVFKWISRVNSANVGLDLKLDTPHGYDNGQNILKVTRNQIPNSSFDPSKKQQYREFSKGL